MKRLILLPLLVCIVYVANAQVIKITRKAVPLYPEQIFVLNSGSKAAFDGQSRVYYPITLPANTVEWYYTFTTNAIAAKTASLGLLTQLTRLVDPTGTTAALTTLLITPTGQSSCNTYLMDRPNADKFKEKTGTFSYFINGSRENFTHGIVQVKNVLQGTWYIGFQNPSLATGQQVQFEAVAIVEERTVSAETEKAVNYGNLGWTSYEAGNLDKAIEYSKKALTLDSTLGYVKANLGLFYLLKGEKDQATEYYIEALGNIKNLPDPIMVRESLDAVVKDLEEAKKKHPVIDIAAFVRLFQIR
jgi:tetratricopeptide (TPR) repeat protein